MGDRGFGDGAFVVVAVRGGGCSRMVVYQGDFDGGDVTAASTAVAAASTVAPATLTPTP